MNVRKPTPETAAKIPAIGELVQGKYRVDAMAGTGGMGVVVSARHQELGHQVAIKFLAADHDTTGAAVERFLREGRVVASLQSDHVVRVYDVGRLESGIPFIVMELLRGQDLSAYVTKSGGVSVEQAVDWLLQAMHAIAEAHEHGIIHRDLKPSNLFLTKRSDGTDCVKVLDFGISKRVAFQDSAHPGAQLTETRQVVGSPAYMSPEQVRNARNIDHRVDIWALGMTLYELLAGRTAFDADTFPAVCAAIVADDPPPLRTLAPNVPEGLERIVMRCLEKDAGNRYASVSALANELRAYGTPPPTSTARAGASSERESASVGGQSATLVSPQSPHSTLERLAPEPGTRPDRTLHSGELDAAPRSDASAQRPDAGRTSRWAWLALALAGFASVAAWKIHRAHTERQQRAATPVQLSVTFESSPPGAKVWDGSHLLGTTPLGITVDRASLQMAPRKYVLEKDGFEPYVAQQGDSSRAVVINASLQPRAVASVSPPPVPSEPPKKTAKAPVPPKKQRAPLGTATQSEATSAPSDIRPRR